MENLINSWIPSSEAMEYLFEEAKGFHQMKNVHSIYYTLAYATLNVTDEEYANLPFASKSEFANLIADELFQMIELWIKED